MATNDWMAKYRQEQADAAKKGKAYLLGLVPVLKAADVEQLVVHYDGEGDSGQIEEASIIVKGSADKVPLSSIPALADENAIQDAVYGVLEEKHAGWEINEGSFGDVVLHVADSRIVIEHNHRIETSEYQEDEV
jgi:Family of unknown function (DUF6878)